MLSNRSLDGAKNRSCGNDPLKDSDTACKSKNNLDCQVQQSESKKEDKAKETPEKEQTQT